MAGCSFMVAATDSPTYGVCRPFTTTAVPLALLPQMSEALVRVIHMLDPPESLMKPNLLMRWLLFKANSYLPAPLQKAMAAAMHWHTTRAAAGGLAAAASSRSPAGPA